MIGIFGKSPWLSIGTTLIGLCLFEGCFTVQETEQVLIIQFGHIERVVVEPGLHFKIPLIEKVVYYDRRLLDYDLPAFEVTAGDQKRLVVDTFTRYRIVDLLKFYKTVNTEAGAQRRLGALIPGLLRSVLGSVPLVRLLSAERAKIMTLIKEQVNEAVQELGIEVIDFRIRRADLPQNNSEAIFARMISDRQKEAKEFRAKGFEVAQEIRARADKDRLILLAEARRKGQVLRGEGDSSAAQIYAKVHGRDPQFYAFWQAMRAYKQTFGPSGNETVFVLSPEQKFFRHWH